MGLENSLYGPIGNSNGQDNLNQIIAAFASFHQLKKTQGSHFIGGLLLIDELDASLHPAAQNKLLNFIIHESRAIGIQTVFTTHSLSLLKHFIQKQDGQEPGSSEIELTYLTKGHGVVEVKENPRYQWIENELLTSSGQRRRLPTIPILTEDDSATWLIKQMLDYFEIESSKFDFLNLSTGWENIITLIKHDFKYFGGYITVLDADVKMEKIAGKLKGTSYIFNDDPVTTKITNRDILSLPNLLPDKCDLPTVEDFRPYVELELWEYLSHLAPDSEFFNDEYISGIPFFHRTLISEGPNEKYHNGNYESKVKAWFRDNPNIINAAIPYFFESKLEMIHNFVNIIIEKYNVLVAARYSQLVPLDKIK